MRNRNKHRLLIKRILLFCLVLFSYCFVISCPDDDLPVVCSVNITSPKNGTIFEEGDLIDFRANITNYVSLRWGDKLPQISMVKWTSDKDGDLETQTYDPAEEKVTHFFSSYSLSVNAHEIKCITFHKKADGGYDRDCSDSILININENTTETTTTITETSTTTTMIDLSLFNHVKITLQTVKESQASYEPPIEDRSTDVLSDYGHEGSFSGFDYSAEWFDKADQVTNVEKTGSVAVTLSSVENVATYIEYHWEEDDLDQDNVYNYTIDFETVEESEIPLINSSATSLTFRVNGFEVCDYVAHYETIKVMNVTTTITRTHRFCDESSTLEVYFYQ